MALHVQLVAFLRRKQRVALGAVQLRTQGRDTIPARLRLDEQVVRLLLVHPKVDPLGVPLATVRTVERLGLGHAVSTGVLDVVGSRDEHLGALATLEERFVVAADRDRWRHPVERVQRFGSVSFVLDHVPFQLVVGSKCLRGKGVYVMKVQGSLSGSVHLHGHNSCTGIYHFRCFRAFSCAERDDGDWRTLGHI